MKILASVVSTIALAVAAAAAHAQPAVEQKAAAPKAASPKAADPAALFGARESVQQVSLSPSGTKVAFVAPVRGRGNALLVVDVAPDAKPQVALSASGDPERISSCFWVSDQRLACNIYMLLNNGNELLPASRLIAVDADGRNMKLLSNATRDDDLALNLGGDQVLDWLTGEDGAILIGRSYVPAEHTGSVIADRRRGFGVDRIDTRSLATKTVEAPREGASEYISDGRGTIRIMGMSRTSSSSDQETGIVEYSYRPAGSRDWKKLGTLDTVTGEGFNPYAVDPDKNVAYGLKKKDGRLAAYAVALDGSGTETLLFAHPQVDVDGFVRIGRSRRVVGVTYATDKRHAVYFDPALQALGRSLGKALPNLPLIDFVDSSADESKLILFAGSDSDPGRYYLFDKARKQLAEMMVSRPDMEGMKLAAVRHVTYKAADGTEVPAYLTLPPGSDGKKLPAIVMPHGGPEARDEWGFDWLSQYIANRGYAVLQPEFRGSSGYGDSWLRENAYHSWKTAIGDVNDAGRWLVAQGIADPAKMAIVGWSYGGYAALQANVLDPALFKATVAIAPVTDLPSHAEEWAGWSNHRLAKARVGTGPEAREGSPAEHADRFVAPVLLFHGDMDRNVAIHQSQLMASRLKGAGKSVELVVYPKHDHQLADSQTRADMLRKADAFLRAAMKLP